MEVDLVVYLAPSGQWSGVLIGVVDGVEVGRVAGCASPEDVVDLVGEQYEVREVKTV